MKPYVYKMHTKLKKKSLFQFFSFPISCWLIDEKTHPLAGVNIKTFTTKGRNMSIEYRL
jgi:hypothetical protein